MSQEPKRRHSKARKRTRRASIMLKQASLVVCKNCGKPTLPHIVCKECGFYGDKQVSSGAVKVTKV
ncbi:50S ribosomal protein L32 [Candidatus Daviesbacteria bacterium]|nr:50S ribosomal protein L32 [Candidatus Daviesbacteria bacterium]